MNQYMNQMEAQQRRLCFKADILTSAYHVPAYGLWMDVKKEALASNIDHLYMSRQELFSRSLRAGCKTASVETSR